MTSSNQTEITVVGAGIAGLLSAYRLNREGHRVTLIEATPRAGGLIETLQTPYGIVERAAHSFLASPPVEALCAELGVELLSRRPGSNARWIVRDGKPRRFPLTVSETVELALRYAFARRPTGPITLGEWARARLGTGACDYLVGPGILGIYACRPDELDLGAAFPKRVRGRKPMKAPRLGMGALVSALERSLRLSLGQRMQLGQKVERLPESRRVVLALPPDEAARLLLAPAPEAAAALSKIRFAPLLTATVFLDRARLLRPPHGIGMMIPAREGKGVLGVLFNSATFKGRVTDESRWVSCTAILGGTPFPAVLEWDDGRVLETIDAELGRLLQLPGGAIVHAEISRWPRAIPLYDGALAASWRRASAHLPAGVDLVGNWTGQVSIRGMIEAPCQVSRTS